MHSNLKIVVRDNVRRLLGLRPGESGVSQVMALGFANGTAQRILDGETSLGLDTLSKLAARLGVEPWQLCVPDLQTDRLPSLEPLPFRWPFARVDPRLVLNLVGTQAQAVEVGLLSALAAAGVRDQPVASGKASSARAA